MTAHRPNRQALSDALDSYRDAMRPFILRRLKRVPRQKVQVAIGSALRDGQYNRFKQNLEAGQSVEESIDITDFPDIVRKHWRDAFKDAFQFGSAVMDRLHRIAEARNKVAHPGIDDVDLQYATDSLSDITSILSEINEPNRSLAVNDIRERLMPLVTPAHRFRQGGRDVYAFALDIETLNSLLPDRVDDSVVKDANRPLTPSHAKRIQKYLEERPDWLLGTLLLGVSPGAVEFHSYLEEEDGITSVGELRIGDSGLRNMKMFDGQHRRRAIKDALRELSHSQRHSSTLSTLKQASLPIMLYAEDDIVALRQMFADAARTKPIERNAVTMFDLTDAFNLAADWIANNSDLFGGRVEVNRASIARGSYNIIAINQLAMTLKTMEVGYKGRISKDRNASYMSDIDSLYDRCWTWADDFMPAARREYNDLMTGEVDNSDIPHERSKTMAYNAVVIRILAGCYYEWTKDGDDWKPLAEFFREASLTPGCNSGTLLVDAGIVAPGGISPAAQQGLVAQGIDYIVRRAKEENSCIGALSRTTNHSD